MIFLKKIMDKLRANKTRSVMHTNNETNKDIHIFGDLIFFKSLIDNSFVVTTWDSSDEKEGYAFINSEKEKIGDYNKVNKAGILFKNVAKNENGEAKMNINTDLLTPATEQDMGYIKQLLCYKKNDERLYTCQRGNKYVILDHEKFKLRAINNDEYIIFRIYSIENILLYPFEYTGINYEKNQ